MTRSQCLERRHFLRDGLVPKTLAHSNYGLHLNSEFALISDYQPHPEFTLGSCKFCSMERTADSLCNNSTIFSSLHHTLEITLEIIPE